MRTQTLFASGPRARQRSRGLLRAPHSLRCASARQTARFSAVPVRPAARRRESGFGTERYFIYRMYPGRYCPTPKYARYGHGHSGYLRALSSRSRANPAKSHIAAPQASLDRIPISSRSRASLAKSHVAAPQASMDCTPDQADCVPLGETESRRTAVIAPVDAQGRLAERYT